MPDLPSRATLRSPDDHLAAIMSVVAPTPQRVVPVALLPPRARLARDAFARRAVPPVSVAAVDGFIAHAEDLYPGARLPVAGDIPAGHPPVTVPRGAAVRIMTGAPVPTPTDDAEGAPGERRAAGATDLAVVPIEDTDAPADLSLPKAITVTHSGTPPRRNIRRAGEHLGVGSLAVPAGTRCDGGTIATLISAGITEVTIHRLPRVAVVTTGDELTGTTAPAVRWAIPNSNGPMLQRLAEHFGAEATHRHVPDDRAALSATLDELARNADLILTVGGISAGAFDVVKACGRAATSRGTAGLEFYPVALRPGKPQGGGTWRGTPMLCLPGNPVAAWASAVLFLAPAIRRLGGGPAARAVAELPQTQLQIPEDMAPTGGRLLARPARVDWARRSVDFAFPHGSHFVGALAGADGLAIASATKLAAGTRAPVLVV